VETNIDSAGQAGLVHDFGEPRGDEMETAAANLLPGASVFRGIGENFEAHECSELEKDTVGYDARRSKNEICRGLSGCSSDKLEPAVRNFV
jgi:hypothetical protein